VAWYGAILTINRSRVPSSAWTRLRTTTLGKLFTSMCLGADGVRYHMESLNKVPFPFCGEASGRAEPRHK